MRGTPEERQRRVKGFLTIQAGVIGTIGIIGLFVFRDRLVGGLLVLFAAVEALFVRFYRGPWVRR